MGKYTIADEIVCNSMFFLLKTIGNLQLLDLDLHNAMNYLLHSKQGKTHSSLRNPGTPEFKMNPKRNVISSSIT